MPSLRLLAGMLLCGLGCSALAHADTVSLADHDSDGLVAAMRQANRAQRPLRIELAPHGLYVLKDCADPRLRLGLPEVTRSLTIVGHGAEIRRYSDGDFALLGVAAGGRLALHDLTLAEGGDGAVVNRGVLHLDGVRITDSSGSEAVLRNYGVLRGADNLIGYNALLGAQNDAGVLLNYGRVELARTQFVGNRSSARPDVIAASALLNLGEARLTDVTVEGNSVLDANGGSRALVTLGNGRLDGTGIVLRDNWPDNWPQESQPQPTAVLLPTP